MTHSFSIGGEWHECKLAEECGIILSNPPEYDVAVVGASFAGLSCAREAARRGLRAVVIDRQTNPGSRIHTTGILVKEAQDEWPAPNHLVREIKRVRIYAPSGRSLSLERTDYFFLATDTQGLLAHLAEEVRASGVDVRFDEPFEGAIRHTGGLILKGLGLSCSFLVGADGARSQVAASFGLDRNEKYLKGVEYAFEPSEDIEESLHCFIDPEVAPGYIAWILPGFGVTQVGLACDRRKTADLDAFVRRTDPTFQLSGRRILEKRGGIIPIGGLLANFYADDVMLVGDAAGMVSPLTAGGIHRAYRYGRLAGGAIADHLQRGGPNPGSVLRSTYPRHAWKHAARWAYDRLPLKPLSEAAFLVPGIFSWVVGKVFFAAER